MGNEYQIMGSADHSVTEKMNNISWLADLLKAYRPTYNLLPLACLPGNCGTQESKHCIKALHSITNRHMPIRLINVPLIIKQVISGHSSQPLFASIEKKMKNQKKNSKPRLK